VLGCHVPLFAGDTHDFSASDVCCSPVYVCIICCLMRFSVLACEAVRDCVCVGARLAAMFTGVCVRVRDAHGMMPT